MDMNDAHECGVCFDSVHLASLDGCRHKLCVDCSIRVSMRKNICPFCRARFVVVTSPDGVEYDTSTKRFKLLPYFEKITPFCMGLARRLIFERNDAGNTYDVFMPQYLHNIPWCDHLLSLTEDGVNPFIYNDVFDTMNQAISEVSHLPLIVTRLTISTNIQNMIDLGVFVVEEDLDDNPVLVAERRELRMNDSDPLEIDGGYRNIIAPCIKAGPGWTPDM
jgi:hypothetical protein